MSERLTQLRHPLAGTPSATVYSGMPQEEIVRRILIREGKLVSTDWQQGSGVTTETELPRGLAVKGELSQSGGFHLEAKGFLNVVNGGTGNITLRLYGSPNLDPNVARASMGVILTAGHTFAVADPGASGGSNGIFNWTLDIWPLAQADLVSTQQYRSRVQYQRYSGDAVTTVEQMGRLTYDFHADTVILPTTQKAAGLSTSTLDFFSIDAWIDNGKSGQAG